MRQRGWQWTVWALGLSAVGCGGAVERNGDPDVVQPQDPNQDVNQPQDPNQEPQDPNQDVNQPQIEVRLSPWVAGIKMSSYHYWLRNSAGALVAEGELQVVSQERYQEYRIKAPLGQATLSVTGNTDDDALEVACEGSIGPFEVLAKDNFVLIPGFTCSDDSTDQRARPDEPEEP